MAGTPKRLYGPAALNGTPTYTTNIYRGAGGSALLFDVVTHIHIINTNNTAVTFRMYIDASGGNTAGKELWYDVSIAANSPFDHYCRLVLVAADYLVGAASTTGVTITIEGEQSVL